MFPLFLEREFPPSTLTKPKLGSEVQREGLHYTTAVASLDVHTLFCPQAPDPEALSPRTAGAVEEDGPPPSALSPPSCAMLGTGQAFVKSLGEPDPLS